MKSIIDIDILKCGVRLQGVSDEQYIGHLSGGRNIGIPRRGAMRLQGHDLQLEEIVSVIRK
jgi:hypothetical protein